MSRLPLSLAAAAALAGCHSGDALVIVEVDAPQPLTVPALHVLVNAAGHMAKFDVPASGGPITIDPSVTFGIDLVPDYFGELDVGVDATPSGGATVSGHTPPTQVTSGGELHLKLTLGAEASDGGADQGTPDLIPFPTCQGAPSHIVCEDFETGMIDTGLWKTFTSNSITKVDSTLAHSGRYALHITPVADSSGGLSGGLYNETKTPDLAPTFYLRAFARTSGVFFANLMKAQTNVPLHGVAVGENLSGALFWTEFTSMPGVVEPVAVFPQGRWACLEMEVSGPAQDAGVPDGGSLGTFSVWLDGSEVLTKQSVTLYPIQRVAFDYIYSFAVQTGNEVWLDDLIVDNSPIGCEN